MSRNGIAPVGTVGWVAGILTIVLSLAVAARLPAQTVTSGAGWVTSLSALGASSRADALGDAFVGLADDPSALFFNSAGLSQLKTASFSINHNSYLGGSFEETVLFGLHVGSLGGFAAALQYVSWGGIDKRDANGVPQGSFADSDVAFSVGWGLSVADGLSMGLALHGSQQKIVDSLYTGFSGDLGLLWVPRHNLRVGLAYTGLGTNLAGFDPVQDLHLGLSTLLDLGRGSKLQPLLAGDWEPRGVSRIQGGLEGTIDRVCFLRLGYQAAMENNQIGGLTGFTAGAGLLIGRVRLDYTFVPYGDLGISHRISVGYEFPEPKPVAPKSVTVMSSPVTVQAVPMTVVVTPTPGPVMAPGPPKSKVEVHFELGGAQPPLKGETLSSTLVASYEKAAEANPGNSRVWRNLGIVYLKSGQTAQGIQCLEQSLRLNPNDQVLKKWLEKYRSQNPDMP